jgi:hypothetical protein
MINKYGTTAPIAHVAEETYDKAPVYHNTNDGYQDYNVARTPKPKAKSQRNRGPTEAEEERAERARRAEQERREAEAAEHAAEHATLKKSVLNCKKAMLC